jgi:SAM-dependent methyltransferase
VSANPYEAVPLNELANADKWCLPEWANIQRELKEPMYYPPDFIHRKTWEWLQCVFGLRKLGILNENSRGLGVGVGHEPLIYLFANEAKEIVATDLYDPDSIWAKAGAYEGDREMLTNPDKYAPFPYRRDRLAVLDMDGLNLRFPENSFDFVWSCCSIEHFGGHEKAARSMREMERVLKSGGVLALTTEFILDQNILEGFGRSHVEFFNLESLYLHVISATSLQLVQDVRLKIDPYYILNSVKIPEEISAPLGGIIKPHIVINIAGLLVTSISLFFRKEG